MSTRFQSAPDNRRYLHRPPENFRSPGYSKNAWFYKTLDRVDKTSKVPAKVPILAKSSISTKSRRLVYDGVVVCNTLPPILTPLDTPMPAVGTRDRISVWVGVVWQKQKDWVKLNVSYLAGTIVGSAAAYVNSYLAKKMGVDPLSASTAVASISQYVFGIPTICACWFFLHKDKYAGNTKKLWRDAAKIVGSTIMAQTLTWGLSWPMTWTAIWLGASTPLAVTLQTQVFDRAIFIPLFNRFNRKRVKEMKQLSDEQQNAVDASVKC